MSALTGWPDAQGRGRSGVFYKPKGGGPENTPQAKQVTGRRAAVRGKRSEPHQSYYWNVGDGSYIGSSTPWPKRTAMQARFSKHRRAGHHIAFEVHQEHWTRCWEGQRRLKPVGRWMCWVQKGTHRFFQSLTSSNPNGDPAGDGLARTEGARRTDRMETGRRRASWRCVNGPAREAQVTGVPAGKNREDRARTSPPQISRLWAMCLDSLMPKNGVCCHHPQEAMGQQHGVRWVGPINR